MKRNLQLAFGICAIGCSHSSSTELNQLASPAPNVTASNKIVATANGPSLEITALITNATSASFTLNDGTECPAIQVFSDPSGEHQVVSSPPLCVADKPALNLAPGDTVVLKRIVSTAYVTSFSPGLYGLNIEVTGAQLRVGVWAGTVRLPLSIAP